jgi:spore maturation protein SpmB
MKKEEKQHDKSGIHLSFDTAKDPLILGIISLTVVVVVVLTFARLGQWDGNQGIGKAYMAGNTEDMIDHNLVVYGSVQVDGIKTTYCKPGTIVYEDDAYWGCVRTDSGNVWKQLDK